MNYTGRSRNQKHPLVTKLEASSRRRPSPPLNGRDCHQILRHGSQLSSSFLKVSPQETQEL